jgi:Ca2+-binding RTX toxin-like protein
MAKSLLSLNTWRLIGDEILSQPWMRLSSGPQRMNEHWTVVGPPVQQRNAIASIDMGGNTLAPGADPRLGDWLTLSNGLPSNSSASRVWTLSVIGATYIDALPGQNIDLQLTSPLNFTTNGSLRSIAIDTGDQVISYTNAARDSMLFTGLGNDRARLIDNPDVAGQQYWALIRAEGGQVDAYSLLTGWKIRMEGTGVVRKVGETGFGAVTTQTTTARTAAGGDQASGRLTELNNYGSVESIELQEAFRTGGPGTLIVTPGSQYRYSGDRVSFRNIDLASDDLNGDGVVDPFSNSFNLADFSFVRYTTNNLWAGQATVHTLRGGANVFSERYTHLGLLNGGHDMPVFEQAVGLDGRLRLYVRDTSTALYNEFNRIYLGTSQGDHVSKALVTGTTPADRVALYGFGGNDVLIGGSANDYLFGGASTYNLLTGDNGNQVTGGAGADFFGVGNVHGTGGATLPGTDVILDWDAGTATTGVDSLRVLANGTAVIGGLYGVGYGSVSLSGNTLVDLRAKAAVATSDNDRDGARNAGGVLNEANDLTVVNEGKIVARGFDGNDTLLGSPGVDYLYGNKGDNLIDLRPQATQPGGNDWAHYDVFTAANGGVTTHQYVGGFEAGDKFRINQEIVAAFGGSASIVAPANKTGGYYSQAEAYDPGLNFLHPRIYSYWLDDNGGDGFFKSNAAHRSAGEDATFTSYAAGAGMIAAGYVLNAFFGLGWPLIISGGFLVATNYIDGGVQHQNAAVNGVSLNGSLNVLDVPGMLRPNTTAASYNGGANADALSFYQFFGGLDAGDGYPVVLEFADHSGPIRTIVAVHSDEETFIYLVISGDNFIENHETLLLAEINGTLWAQDFDVYNGASDIYNPTNPGNFTLVTPVITEVDGAAPTNVDILAGTTTTSTSFTVSGSATGANGAQLTLYAGSTSVATGAVSGGVFSLIDPNTYQSSLAMVIDGSGDDTYEYSDVVVRYSVGLRDTATGIVTRSNIHRVTVETPITADGGGGYDTLQVSERTAHRLGESSNGQIVNIEAISAAPATEAVSFSLAAQTESLNVTGSAYADTITGSAGASTLDGGAGNDILTGNSGNDVLIGDAGAETTVGPAPQYEVFTNDGPDDDTLDGGGGNDVLQGARGDDSLVGGSGADTITGGVGSDVLAGGTGADLLVMAPVAGSVISFEGLVAADDAGTVPSVYGGFNWNNIGVIGRDYYADGGYKNVVNTGTASTYSYDRSLVELTKGGSDFYVASGYFAAAWNSGLTISFAAWDDGVQVGTATVVLGTDKVFVNFADQTASGTGLVSATFDGRFVSIDEFTYTGSGGTNAALGGDGQHVAMDDLAVGVGAGDRVLFAAGDGAAAGASTGYDVVSGFTKDDTIEIVDFADRDGVASSLLYDTATLGRNKTLDPGTELLIVSDSAVAGGASLAGTLADILEDRFDLSALDDGQLVFAIKGSEADTYWLGLYQNAASDDIVATFEMTVLGKVTGDALNDTSFWLPTVLAPQELVLDGRNGLVNAPDAIYTGSYDVDPNGTSSGFLNVYRDSARVLDINVGQHVREDDYGAILLNYNSTELDMPGDKTNFLSWFAPGVASKVTFEDDYRIPGDSALLPADDDVNTYFIITGWGGTSVWRINSGDAAVTASEVTHITTFAADITSADVRFLRDPVVSGAIFVSVDGQSGGRAWLDTDEDGVLDAGETALTLNPSRDSSNTLGGVDFSTKQVTVAFWQFDGPTIDLAGFDSDDKVMIDFTRWGDSLQQESGVQGIFTGSNIIGSNSLYSTRGLKMTNIRGRTESCVFMVDWASWRSIDLQMLSRPMALFSSGSAVSRTQIDITWPHPLGGV